MAKIKDLLLKQLHNEEHMEFHTEFKGLVNQFTPQILKIEKQFESYLALLKDEGEALNRVKKSAITQLLCDADFERDSIYAGLGDGIRSSARHFNPQIREAAKRLLVMWESLGNVARKPYDKETAAITKLVTDLKESHATDINTLSLGDWVNELNTKNIAFDDLKTGRYDENDDKTRIRMAEVRVDVDQAYLKIVERIDAMITLEDEYDFTPFVNQFNLRIDAYNIHVAHRAGRAKKSSDVASA